MRDRRPCLVLIPGLQGRHEWYLPTLTALEPWFDAVTFPLTSEAGARDPFAAWTARIDALVDRTGAERAVIVGHSFGGLVAVHCAVALPARVSALVLASAPAPGMALSRQQERFIRRPYLTLPLFAAGAAVRLAPELHAARDTWPGRLGVAAAHLRRGITAPIPPGLMARWVRAWKSQDLAGACHAVQAPTLVLTGEPRLDRVVPVASSREYLSLIPNARHEILPGVGHLGPIIHPEAWAEAVHRFVGGFAPAVDAGDNMPMADTREGAGARHD